MTSLEKLEKLKPCPEGLDYAKQFASLEKAWNGCVKSGWMWWYLRRTRKISRSLPASYSKACIEHMNIALASYDKSDPIYHKYVNNSINHAINANNRVCSYVSYAIINAERVAYHARDSVAAAASCVAFNNANDATTHANACAIYNTEFNKASKQQADILRSLTSNPFKTL